MKIICLSQDGSKRITFSMNLWTHIILPSVGIACLSFSLAVAWGLYHNNITQYFKSQPLIAAFLDDSSKPLYAVRKQLLAQGEAQNADDASFERERGLVWDSSIAPVLSTNVHSALVRDIASVDESAEMPADSLADEVDSDNDTDNNSDATVASQQATQQTSLALNSSISPASAKDIDIEILTQHLGKLEAELSRLNAFATRIAKVAKLDPKEFNFDKPASVGGIVYNADKLEQQEQGDKSNSSNVLLSSIANLEGKLVEHRYRLDSMLQVLQGRVVEGESIPDLMPIRSGYLSSGFGLRRDPFTGKQRMHGGIDFAGQTGDPVMAVAGGIVAFVGRNGGYGISVEIDHGNNIKTRYAHLNKAIVKLEHVVKKGQMIGELGSTGRSTGPHLHFEVLKNGVRKNPRNYLKPEKTK